MSIEHLTMHDIMWLNFQKKLAGGEHNVAKFYEAMFSRAGESTDSGVSFGVGKYQRTYACGCTWQNYCDECQEPQ